MERMLDDRGWNDRGPAIAADLLAKNWWALVTAPCSSSWGSVCAGVAPRRATRRCAVRPDASRLRRAS